MQAIKLGRPDGFLSHGCHGRKLAISNLGTSALYVAPGLRALARLQPANISITRRVTLSLSFSYCNAPVITQPLTLHIEDASQSTVGCPHLCMNRAFEAAVIIISEVPCCGPDGGRPGVLDIP